MNTAVYLTMIKKHIRWVSKTEYSHIYSESYTTLFYGLYNSKIIIKIQFGLEEIHHGVSAKEPSLTHN